MNHRHLVSTFILCIASSAFAQTQPATQPTTQANNRARALPPDVLPGSGLAEHPFLYCGEWDTRNPMETIFIIKGGKVAWTYQIPDKSPDSAGKMQLNEFDDVHYLSNGHVLFAKKTGAGEVDQDKNLVWNFDAPQGTEIHSAQPIGLDKVFLCENGLPARCVLIDKKTNTVLMQHDLPTKENATVKDIHGEYRHIRLLQSNGHYLIPALELGKVFEFDKDWNQVWSVDAHSCWAAVRLKNGNTLVSGNQNGYVREFNPAGQVVWDIEKDDLPGCPLYTVQECNRLSNGNTIISNWGGSIQKSDWDKVVQVIEVNPDKKVVWALHEWKDPDLGPSSCIQLLDEPGIEENGDLMR